MEGPQGWSEFFDEISQLMSSSSRRFSSANEDYVDYILEKLSICIRNTSAIKEVVDQEVNGNSAHQLYRIYQVLNDMVSQLIALRRRWSDCLDSLESRFDHVRYRAPTDPTIGVAGRPRFHITHDQLEYLRSFSFSWTEIARLLGVSRMTIYRRRVEYGLVDEPVLCLIMPTKT